MPYCKLRCYEANLWSMRNHAAFFCQQKTTKWIDISFRKGFQLKQINSLHETNNSHLKIGKIPKGISSSNHPFSGAKMLVSGSVSPLKFEASTRPDVVNIHGAKLMIFERLLEPNSTWWVSQESVFFSDRQNAENFEKILFNFGGILYLISTYRFFWLGSY